MVVGVGSASWHMVCDLARRLPAMVLPRWLKNHSWPIDVSDVAVALAAALDLPEVDAGVYDLPGPERLSAEEILRRTARQMGKHPAMVGVPLLSPYLSSVWIALVTRARWSVAKELVEGLKRELDPTERVFWEMVPHLELTPFDVAVARALSEEQAPQHPSVGMAAKVSERARRASLHPP